MVTSPVAKLAVVVFLLASSVGAALAQTRLPWTTSAIEGSPDPAKPFVAERVLPQLNFSDPVELAVVPGTNRFLIVERRGKISSFATRGEVSAMDEVIDLLPLHPRLDHAFGVVLHPRFRETRQIFICYALPDGQLDGSRVSRFTLTSLDPLRADPASEEIILTWRSGGHNGGSLQFGPDGFLYISTGDAGPAAPPDLHNTGQDTSDLLASILRIDIDGRDAGKNYRVPADNPWANRAADKIRPELWAYGLRNPWKISFDRVKGDLWCGDIGWELWEMIHLIKRGGNYGWSAFEGSQRIKPELANLLSPISPPIVAHAHSEAASMTGGFVYHGKLFPELAGAYVYGDYMTGKIWALWYDGSQITRHEEIADTPHTIISFGQDDDGELYYLHYPGRGSLHRLVRNPAAAAPAARFPRTLSATGLFADTAKREPAAGVYPFTIASPMWEDGTAASRLIALRGSSRVATTVKLTRNRRSNEVKADYTTTWPKGAVLARTVTLGELAPTAAERAKPIETQVLHYDGETWNAYAYRWNDHGTEADLVPAEGAEVTIRAAADPNALGPRTRDYTWRFHSRAECLRCHSARMDGALAFTSLQLRGAGAQQRDDLIDAGIVDANFFEQTRGGGEITAGENRSARAVLHANCAHCHTAHAGGSVPIFLGAEKLAGEMNLVDEPPTQGGLGLKQPKLIAPGDPWNSVLAVRMAKLGHGRMPLIGSREVDVAGLRVVEDWIARMASAEPAVKPWADTAWDETIIASELATVGGAMRVRRAIDDGKLGAGLSALAFRIAWKCPEATVRDIFERFKPDAQRERTLGAVVNAAELLRLPGDAARGARLVAAEGKLASCQACHFIQGQGRHFGPDLSRIGAQQTAAQILESIVAPSKTIAPLYRATTFALADGTGQLGFVRARGAEEIVVTIASGQSIKIKKTEIRDEATRPESLMPEGLLQGLTPQEAADVVAYLASLK